LDTKPIKSEKPKNLTIFFKRPVFSSPDHKLLGPSEKMHVINTILNASNSFNTLNKLMQMFNSSRCTHNVINSNRYSNCLLWD